ncbi:MAG: ABC transporter ATP-binding protein [Xanthobacteraceae bacterium]
MASVDSNRDSGEVIVENVTKAIGDEFISKTIVQDCAFKVARGKFTVLIGPSGCGKTTLINLIAGYDQPTLGRVTLDGQTITGPTSERLVVFQETALFPWMTVFQNVTYGPSVQRKAKSSDTDSEANALLARFGLKDFRDKYPNQLSGGMQRRAELARALINRPRVLLMDEPFRGLDAMTRQLMQEYLLRLFEGSGQTILFVTSEIDEAILLADTIVLLSRSPATTKDVIDVDIPRPRNVSIFETQQYAELKRTALSLLYREAVDAFASGSTSAADLVEAFEIRHGPGAS